MSQRDASPLPPPPPPPPPAPPTPTGRVRPGRISGWAFIGLGFAFFLTLGFLAALIGWDPERSAGGSAGRSTPICDETDRLLDAAEAEPIDDVGAVSDLWTVLPSDVGSTFELSAQEAIPDAETLGDDRGPVWLAELREDGFRRGVVRGWSRSDGTIAVVQVLEFHTSSGALAFQRFALEDQSCPYSYDIFTVDGVRHSIGLQIAWADDTESEQVSFVLGPRRYLANVRAENVPDRRLVLDLTRRVFASAR